MSSARTTPYNFASLAFGRLAFIALGTLAMASCSAGGSASGSHTTGGDSGTGGDNGGDGTNINPNTVGSTVINGVVYTASSLIGGSTIDPNHFWPPTGQDCGVQMGSGGNVLNAAPQAFLDECAGCHTAQGTGTGPYPNIVGQADFNSFSANVRNGIKGGAAEMPAFKTTWLNDNDLHRIFAFLSKQPITETGACTPSPTMSASDIAAASTAGLAAWRQFDGVTDPNGLLTNVACVQCHAPDPLDIAYYGYSDGDILRRGTAHLPAANVANIVDMVHGLRTKYSIGRRDPLVARPFQPGGLLLDGNSIAARDAKFMQQMVDMNLIVATRPIQSAADANAAMDEVWNINRHTLPIPIPYNHYTEDQFHNPPGYVSNCNDDIDNCIDHGSIADWISIVPHTVTDFNNYFKQADAYIANPNLATFSTLRYAAGTSKMFGTYTGANYGTDGMDNNKYPSQVLANYCIRLELTGQKGCYEQGVTPFPNMADIWDVGAGINLYGTGYGNYPSCDTTWTNCGQAPANLPQWQWFVLNDITPGATLSSNFSRLRHVWMNLWWTHFDPTLLVTGDPTAQKDEYFTRSMYWVNENDWVFNNTPAAEVHPAYASYNAYQVMTHNIATLKNPQVAACNKFPATDFNCTLVDLRSGYYPDLVNFAEQNQPQNSQANDNINYQVQFQPASGAYRAQYQMLVTNMYRMFFWGLIGQLQQDNWMCNQTLENLRIVRAQLFFAQAETQAANQASDNAMFQQLQSLMAKSTASCPPLTSQ